MATRLSRPLRFVPSFASSLPCGLVCSLGLVWLGLAWASVAAAAPPPSLGGGGGSGPEQEACAGRSLGDACKMPNNQLGTCGQGTCNRLDYSQGSPPKAIEEPCVVCQPGGSGGSTAGGHGGPPALGSGGSPPPADSGASEGDAKEPPASASRCTVVDDFGGAPLGLAVLALLGVALYPRRRA